MKTADKIQAADQKVLHCYNRVPTVFDHGEGAYLYDTDGKKYLDFVGGIAVNALGYQDQGLLDTINDQAKKLMHISNLYWTEPVMQAAETITKATGMDRVFFCNSGTEAVEGAIKLARMAAKRDKSKDAVEIVSMIDSFHGRSYVATTASGQDHFHENLEPLPGGFKYVPFNDLDALRDAIGPNTCAVLMETVQGEGGILPADPDYLKAVRKLCDDKQIYLILDEIQCGAARTGGFLAADLYGIKPDIVTMAKGIGAGFPVGAFLAEENIASAMPPGTHGSTYGGNALACAVVDYVVSKTSSPEFLASVKEKGQHLEEELKKLKDKHPDKIDAVRGLGLIQGIVLNPTVNAEDLVGKARENGLLLVSAKNNVIRLVPPLTVSLKEIEEAINLIDQSLESFDL